jgi:hypothetical protein
MKFVTIFCLMISFSAEAFVLLNPKFELHDGTKTKVKISSEGCTGNGVSDAKVSEAIKWAIDFWNDVPESSLKLSYGGKSSASLTDPSVPTNEIIVGCGTLSSAQILGSTQNDRTHGSARITMNKDVYTGSYNENSFIGTVTHEIGHGLGLFHSNDPASVMTYANHGWVDRPKYISQDDIDGVVYLYPNKAYAAGLLGSCSSFASNGKSSKSFYEDVILGLLGILLVTTVFQFLLKKSRSILFKKK